MSLQCIFNRFSVYVDVVSNENVALFWIQSLSVCRAITFLITELIMFSPAQQPVVSVSIIEPEAPGVLLRFENFWKLCARFGIISASFVLGVAAPNSATASLRPPVRNPNSTLNNLDPSNLRARTNRDTRRAQAKRENRTLRPHLQLQLCDPIPATSTLRPQLCDPNSATHSLPPKVCDPNSATATRQPQRATPSLR